MKKLLVVMLVLSMASMANAALYINVNGVANPPDSEITLLPSESVTISITGDGLTPQDQDFWLVAEPLGTSTMAGGAMIYAGDMSAWAFNTLGDGSGIVEWLRALSDGTGYDTKDAYWMLYAHSGVLPLNGLLFDEITFHCDAPGDVMLTLVNIFDDGAGSVVKTVYDTQIIHQAIPEPMTLGLLGLGGLFLRRRK
jgi:hypothetical protein